MCRHAELYVSVKLKIQITLFFFGEIVPETYYIEKLAKFENYSKFSASRGGHHQKLERLSVS